MTVQIVKFRANVPLTIASILFVAKPTYRQALLSLTLTSRPCNGVSLAYYVLTTLLVTLQSMALPRVTYYIVAEWLTMLDKLRHQLKTLLFLRVVSSLATLL
jgi:hypothetical protein